MAKDRIPTSRIARTARIARLAAGQGARQLGTQAANVDARRGGPQAALERRHIEAAEQIVTALGTMKGAAMKLGQVLSFLDVGLVPEEYREEFQRKLGELRDAAPKVRFADMRKVIESELGRAARRRLRGVRRGAGRGGLDRPGLPRAARTTAARSRSRSSTRGVAQAVRADMQNLGMILRLMKQVAPGLDVKATAEEIRARIDEELDYELEAQNQRSLARIFRGHPFIVVPDVVTELSRERVLVTEFVARRRLRRDQADGPGDARPRRRDRLPLLLRLHVPPPPVLRRPAPGQLHAARRRPAWRSSTSGCSR